MTHICSDPSNCTPGSCVEGCPCLPDGQEFAHARSPEEDLIPVDRALDAIPHGEYVCQEHQVVLHRDPWCARSEDGAAEAVIERARAYTRTLLLQGAYPDIARWYWRKSGEPAGAR